MKPSRKKLIKTLVWVGLSILFAPTLLGWWLEGVEVLYMNGLIYWFLGGLIGIVAWSVMSNLINNERPKKRL